MRIEDMITEWRWILLMLQQILPTTSIENVKDQQMRILLLILGFRGIKDEFRIVGPL